MKWLIKKEKRKRRLLYSTQRDLDREKKGEEEKREGSQLRGKGKKRKGKGNRGKLVRTRYRNFAKPDLSRFALSDKELSHLFI